jgi:hypothetical protein
MEIPVKSKIKETPFAYKSNYQKDMMINTTNVVSANPTQAMQHYVIKFVSDLRQIGGFLRVLRFPPQAKLTATIYTNYHTITTTTAPNVTYVTRVRGLYYSHK